MMKFRRVAAATWKMGFNHPLTISLFLTNFFVHCLNMWTSFQEEKKCGDLNATRQIGFVFIPSSLMSPLINSTIGNFCQWLQIMLMKLWCVRLAVCHCLFRLEKMWAFEIFCNGINMIRVPDWQQNQLGNPRLEIDKERIALGVAIVMVWILIELF